MSREGIIASQRLQDGDRLNQGETHPVHALDQYKPYRGDRILIPERGWHFEGYVCLMIKTDDLGVRVLQTMARR